MNKYEQAEQEAKGAMVVVLTFCGFMLIICFIGMFSSCSNHMEKIRSLEAGMCVETDRVKTGERRSCGKACNRDVESVTYMCESGQRIRTHLD